MSLHRDCPTGKIRFRDARGATVYLRNLRGAAARAEEAGGSHRVSAVRKYQCPECDGWHLTSWETW